MKRWPRTRSVVPSRGSSDRGTPTSPLRFASKCTAPKQAT